VEHYKDNQLKRFVEGIWSRLYIVPRCHTMPIEMNIVEMRPYTHRMHYGFAEETEIYYQPRVDAFDRLTKEYSDQFPEGETDWTRPLSKFPQMCDSLGNLLFVGYAVAETQVLM
jgi:hypothetical protein